MKVRKILDTLLAFSSLFFINSQTDQKTSLRTTSSMALRPGSGSGFCSWKFSRSRGCLTFKGKCFTDWFNRGFIWSFFWNNIKESN